jgi:lipoprotein-anchoring transpeptidase ErfK/SrfK
VTNLLNRLAALLLLTTLAACGAPPPQADAPVVTPGYEGFQDGEFFIEPVAARHLTEQVVRREVDYTGPESAGTIIVDTHSRKLYYVLEGGRAMRYGIAVGREGLAFQGNGTIQRKAEWPSWQPTANMLRTQPEMYGHYAAGLPGGLENPLGARAMYLYKGGRDTYFRIHGTVDNASIGRATSAGCIRLFNQDAIDLYDRVKIGAKVKVRTLEESLEAEGPYMDDAWGRAVPDTPENEAQKAKDAELILAEQAMEEKNKAKEEERLAKETAKADRKRLRVCRNKGIDEADCPPLDPNAV